MICLVPDNHIQFFTSFQIIHLVKKKLLNLEYFAKICEKYLRNVLILNLKPSLVQKLGKS